MSFSFQLQQTLGLARTGLMLTDHGVVETPMFMPVGTQASVKALDMQDLAVMGAQIILANTYHLYLRPGVERLQHLGGVHQLSGWQKPLLTDSGGFQVFSLGKAGLVEVREDGVGFRSHLDGSSHFFTPTKAIEIQRVIGADIIMAFDQCTADSASYEDTRAAMERTHRWAAECVVAWERADRRAQTGPQGQPSHTQALFGIVQGAMHADLRRESAQAIAAMPFSGVAVGGETIGYNMAGTAQVMEWIEPILPRNKPRYAMGLGFHPQNIIDAVWLGFDIFDCVAPTRIARHGTVYCGRLEWPAVTTARGAQTGSSRDEHTSGNWDERPRFVSEYANARLNLGSAQFALDGQVIMPGCECWTCSQGYTRAYLHHLYKVGEMAYHRLASIHNLFVLLQIVRELRVGINKRGSTV